MVDEKPKKEEKKKGNQEKYPVRSREAILDEATIGYNLKGEKLLLEVLLDIREILRKK